MATIVVTGATGNIGRPLVELLSRGPDEVGPSPAVPEPGWGGPGTSPPT